MAKNLRSVITEHFGHGIVKARTYHRETPAWVWNDRKVRKLILGSFPKCQSDEKQKTAAARWALVIHLYFRMGYTRSQIADELGTSTERIKSVIRSIYRVSEGRRANGTGLKTGHLGKQRGVTRKRAPK